MKKHLMVAFVLMFALVLGSSCTKAQPTPTESSTVQQQPTVATPVAEVKSTPAAPKASVSTLQQIRDRGYIVVGVNASNPGFAYLQEDGSYQGFEIDLAKALSVAVFGSPDKLEFRPLTSKERFVALQSGEIDVLIRTATVNLSRDTELGLDFTSPYFYDGQTFVVRDNLGINTIEDLEGASIAVLTGSTTETNLAATMASKNISYRPLTFENLDEMKSAFINGRVDAVSVDKSSAVVFLAQFENAGDFKGLEETISKEPLGIAVRHGDSNWKDICQWTLFAMFYGDEHNITSANVDEVRATTSSPETKNVLGTGKELGPMMGLSLDWAYQIIKQVGNYGEIFDRNLGIPLRVTRGYNKPWNQGGLFYANPFN
ncbi:MAG: amino acid ABC transporter substrate-binding protein [Sphaerochaeta sp.]|uniref:amino acid ABC transporter substrate-binding protein n=1 Tax=Sphaerochaeta sp. TaxID=1972642 RepID=UPI003D0DBEC7